MKSLAFAVLIAAALLFAAQDPEPEGHRPVDVFADLDGVWAGTFVGYDATGKELYRIEVRQEYRTIDDQTQEVVVRDTMPDGVIIEGKGRNVARRLADGSLQLECVVSKSNGERVKHHGRVITGPTGKPEIVWYSVAGDRTETFREWVRESDTYCIEGMGQYGKTRMLMAGEYRRL